MIGRFAVIAAGALALSACGQSDERIKADLRGELMEGCAREVAPAVAPNAEPQRFCTCFVDRSMGSRSVAELRAMPDEEKAGVGEQAAAACRAEATGRPAPAPPSQNGAGAAPGS